MDSFEDILCRCETELRGKIRYPLDVEELVKLLGIGLSRARTSKEQHPRLLTDRAGIRILLPGPTPNGGGWNERDRFSVAHEVGHYLIWRATGYMPRGSADYWRHEALCNDFAARLLVPRAIIQDFAAHIPPAGGGWLVLPHDLATQAQVSWEVATRRVTQETSRAYYFLAVRMVNARKVPVWRVSSSSFDRGSQRRMGVYSHILVDSPEGCLIESLSSRSETGVPTDFRLSRIVFSGCTLVGRRHLDATEFCLVDPAAVEVAQG